MGSFEQLAGMREAKTELTRVIEQPLKYNALFSKFPIKLSRGVLLYGGSGTGKSALGAALASHFSLKFFSLRGSDILSKYIGGS
jgi:SpoVK/Ycf46/Vps4 family AAA+-type ATPase